MWSRQDLKLKGKMAFKDNYWSSVIVAFALFLLSSVMIRFTRVGVPSQDLSLQFQEAGLSTNSMAPMMALIGIVGFIISFLFDIFVRNMIVVGVCRFFIRNGEEEKASFGYLISAYADGKFINVFVTMLLKNVFLGLWSCLFIVPGIVKYYSYRMVPYILADHPDISPMDAITLSREIMDGNKMDAFVLDLSFIGWNILGVITCELAGIFYVFPYQQATNAELYRALKK